MILKATLAPGFEQPLIWMNDPWFQTAMAAELAKGPLVDFDRPMAVRNEKELVVLRELGCKVEML